MDPAHSPCGTPRRAPAVGRRPGGPPAAPGADGPLPARRLRRRPGGGRAWARARRWRRRTPRGRPSGGIWWTVRSTDGACGIRALLEALAAVQRHRFVPPQLQDQAYADTPLPIGFSQTISQPYIVAYMTEALRLPPDATVLEIGTGVGLPGRSARGRSPGRSTASRSCPSWPNARRICWPSWATTTSTCGRAMDTAAGRRPRRSTPSSSRRRPTTCRRRWWSSSRSARGWSFPWAASRRRCGW